MSPLVSVALQIQKCLDRFRLVEQGLERLPVEQPPRFGCGRNLFLCGPLVLPGKGGKTHQPLTRRDPVNEGDHKVDVGNLVEVLGNEVQPVVDALHRVNIGPNQPCRATFFVDQLHHFIGHSVVLANHVFLPRPL